MNDTELSYLKLIQIPSYLLAVGKLLVVFFLVAVTMLIALPWQQTAPGYGRVVAFSPTDRQQDIHSPVDGRLGKWFVQEGSHVNAKDPIVEIYDNDPEILGRLKMEKQALDTKLKALEDAYQLTLINVKRQKSLYDAGISSRRTYEQAELEKARYLSDISNTQVELTNINVRISRQETQLIRSPRAGIILRRMAGQESVFVKSGTMLATLVPDTESRAAEIWVNGNDVPLIETGQAVRLQFEGWPAIQFSGWPSVAIGTFGGRVAVVDEATANQQGLYRVLIVPDPNEKWPSARYLRQGVRVNGWILLSRVSLGFELWRRFNGFPLSREHPT